MHSSPHSYIAAVVAALRDAEANTHEDCSLLPGILQIVFTDILIHTPLALPYYICPFRTLMEPLSAPDAQLWPRLDAERSHWSFKLAYFIGIAQFLDQTEGSAMSKVGPSNAKGLPLMQRMQCTNEEFPSVSRPTSKTVDSKASKFCSLARQPLSCWGCEKIKAKLAHQHCIDNTIKNLEQA